jgi:hypothetical protein
VVQRGTHAWCGGGGRSRQTTHAAPPCSNQQQATQCLTISDAMAARAHGSCALCSKAPQHCSATPLPHTAPTGLLVHTTARWSSAGRGTHTAVTVRMRAASVLERTRSPKALCTPQGRPSPTAQHRRGRVLMHTTRGRHRPIAPCIAPRTTWTSHTTNRSARRSNTWDTGPHTRPSTCMYRRCLA